MNLQVKQRIPLKIKRMGINGEGIGFYKKTLVFVPGALKGEEVFCQVVSVKRNFVQAKLLKINKPSKFRVEPACSIYEDCGGWVFGKLRWRIYCPCCCDGSSPVIFRVPWRGAMYRYSEEPRTCRGSHAMRRY